MRFLIHWFAVTMVYISVSIGAVGQTKLLPAQGRSPSLAAKDAPASGTSRPGRVALYASVGEEVIQYSVDVKAARLTKRGSVTLPATVQEGWAHPSRQYLYLAWGARAATASSADKQGVTAFSIDSSGALHPHGEPISLPSRPIYITGDIPGTHVLVARSDPAGVNVYSIAQDGTLSSEVKPPSSLDVGVFPHQVRVAPSNHMVILAARGHAPANGKPEDPGALKIYGYNDGTLENRASIAPGKGFGFQPRHVDFHPSKPWVFVSLEPQNKLYVYQTLDDGTLSPDPLFIEDTLADPKNVRPLQKATTVHVHPNGRYVYLANSAIGTVDFQGKPVFIGGENNIAVYRINQETGEPTLIQNADTHGILPRTFAIDPTGRILVVANEISLAVRDGNKIRTVLPCLTIFRIGSEGKLEFVHQYDVDAGGKPLFWMTMTPLS